MTKGGRFDPREIAAPDGIPPDDAPAILGTARLLEQEARLGAISPPPGFTDAVMAAIVAEPAPRPWSALIAGARRGSVGAVAAAIGDAWRVAWGAGRPVVVRAQAFGIVAVVALVLGSTATIGAVGVSRLIPPTQPEPVPGPTLAAPSPSSAPTPTLEGPGLTPAPSAEASTAPTQPAVTEPSTSTPSSAPSQGGGVVVPPSAGGHETPHPTRTPRPSPTAEPTRTPPTTPEPSESPGPTSTPTESESPTPLPTPDPSPRTSPRPTATPTPTPTPQPTPKPTDEPSPTPTPKEH